MSETRSDAYRRFLEVLGVKPHEEAPSHRIAFNVVWHAAIDQVRASGSIVVAGGSAHHSVPGYVLDRIAKEHA